MSIYVNATVAKRSRLVCIDGLILISRSAAVAETIDDGMRQMGRGNSATGELAYAHSGASRHAPLPARWPLRVMSVSSSSPLNAPRASALMDHGIELRHYSEGTAALLAVADDDPAAILVATDIEGVDFIRFVIAIVAWSEIPVIVGLTNSPVGPEKAFEALEHGASTMIGLPCTPDQLAVALRNIGLQPSRDAMPLTVGTVTVDQQAHRVSVQGDAADLTPRELQFLKYLMSESPRIVSVQELVKATAVYGEGTPDGGRSLVRKVRKKLDDAHPGSGALLQTVHGLGYRFVDRS